MNFSIKGTGHVLPKLVITNDDLAKMVDTSDEWIVSKTGIKERRVLTDESITDLAIKAARLALDDSGLDASQIDMVICSSICGDAHTPSTACLVAASLGINKPSFDINAACTGFIYALDIAAGYYARKKVKNILIVCSEHMSKHTDWTDRATCVLFGDGAGAVVLGEGDDLLSIRLTSTPGDEHMRIPFTGGDSPFNNRKPEKPFLYMNGQEIYKFAIYSASTDLAFVTKEAGVSENDLSYVLLHQANMRIVNAIKDKMKLSSQQILTCIERTGNISSVTLPILLDEGNKGGVFKNGDLIALSAFGGGLTSGAAILRWSKGAK